MPESLYRHPTHGEIVELAAAEGHDADIPTNAGSINDCPAPPSKAESPSMELDKDIDVEKGNASSLTSLVESHSGSEAAPEKDEEEHHDPKIVFWDGPDDPQNPMNWSEKKKWGTVTVVSCITFLTPLASSMFAPGVPEVMKTFHSTNDMLEGFMVSVYVLGFAFGPLFFAPLSEMYGRLPLYHTCNVFFIIFTIAAAVASNMSMFIVFRFFMGCFGGAPLVLGGGTIADIIPREQRGTAMVVWMMGPTIGPCVGPIIGGYLTAARGWRWNFWLVAIVAGAFTIVSMILMSETSAPVLLERKARRLRASTGNAALKSKLDSGLTPKQLFKFSIVRPTRMLLRAPICTVISIYCAMTYAYLYILFTTFTAVFTTQYAWHGGVVGLSFLGLGVGSLLGQWVFTHFGNKTVAKHIARGDFQPEHRLGMMCVGGFFLPVGLFWYGWSVQAQTHYMVPVVGTGVLGFGLLMTFMPASTYLVDVFTVHAASAMAASTVLRSLTAALIPLSSQQMYARLGYGWGNSLLAFLSVALVPIPFVLIRYGERIRRRTTVKL
ncbi:MFS general substrate transporter [Westerdykella ornata]|uniref:MFS general substrate transporter n=1 Tax=Westerdykella ornata TaxID=318751 RepID=A0A6A6JPG6_WESOR|nr:MFS general substrate transporter [Westerdykella ornata]KAF2277566.1 MFS general substrate transporter [Westerdykella ornata]